MGADLWDGLEDAEIFERGKYMEANFIGIVEMKKTLAKETLKNGMAFIVEMEVIKTNMPDKHPEGQKVTWYQGLKDKTVAFPSIVAWAAACLGINPKGDKAKLKEVRPLLPEAMKEATDSPEDNPFIGVQLKLSTFMVKTKKSGGNFTVYDFEPLAA